MPDDDHRFLHRLRTAILVGTKRSVPNEPMTIAEEDRADLQMILRLPYRCLDFLHLQSHPDRRERRLRRK